METKKANIISYYELSDDWKNEALNNLDEYAIEAMYLEPDCDYDENIVLWDLNECFPYDGNYKGFKFNATIGISNNTAMLLNIDDSGETAEYIIV